MVKFYSLTNECSVYMLWQGRVEEERKEEEKIALIFPKLQLLSNLPTI